jgi:hydroxylamine reductase (hybrid-cluster protein)
MDDRFTVSKEELMCLDITPRSCGKCKYNNNDKCDKLNIPTVYHAPDIEKVIELGNCKYFVRAN